MDKPNFPVLVKASVIHHERTGAAARKLRERKKISLRTVAKKMEISAPYLSDLERGFRTWTEDRCQQFTKALEACA